MQRNTIFSPAPPRQKTKDVFTNPQEYKANSTYQEAIGKHVLQSLYNANEIKESDRILDLGCGDGRLTALMAKFVPNGMVLGIDISVPMIRQAIQDHDSKNLHFSVMDAEENKFVNQFDLVIALHSIYWMKKLTAVLAGIKRALTDSGRMVLLIALRNNMDQTIDNITVSAKWKSYFKGFTLHRDFLTKEKYEQFILGAGLTIHSSTIEIMQHRFEDKYLMIGFLAACLPHSNYLPAEKKHEFFADIVDAYCALTKQVGARQINFNIPELIVKANKPTLVLENVAARKLI